MSELCKLSIMDMHNGLMKKKFSASELAIEHIKAIKNDNINAFVADMQEVAQKQAKIADESIADGKNINPLLGIPIGIKDLFCIKNIRTQSCSKILQDFIPPYTATVCEKLSKCGTIFIGKTNMDEMAMGSTNQNSTYGPAMSPWIRNDGKRVVPGGSSGGSAAAVAGFMCPGALGSDTGGSVRQPAAFCGTVGIKPTYGRCSRWGMIAFASSLDQAGVITRCVKDAAILLAGISGHDVRDSTSSQVPVPDFLNCISGDVKGKTIGIPKQLKNFDISDEIASNIDKVCKILSDSGALIKEVDIQNIEYGLPAYYIISTAEASSNLSRYDGVRYGLHSNNKKNIDEMYKEVRTEGFCDEVKTRILIGNYVLSHGYKDAYYSKAQLVRQVIRRDFENVFKNVDAVLTPTTLGPAFVPGEVRSGLDTYLTDIFTASVNLAGLPAISVPSGLSNTKLPLGIQIIGKHFDEPLIMNFAAAIEAAVGAITPQ